MNGLAAAKTSLSDCLPALWWYSCCSRVGGYSPRGSRVTDCRPTTYSERDQGLLLLQAPFAGVASRGRSRLALLDDVLRRRRGWSLWCVVRGSKHLQRDVPRTGDDPTRLDGLATRREVQLVAGVKQLRQRGANPSTNGGKAHCQRSRPLSRHEPRGGMLRERRGLDGPARSPAKWQGDEPRHPLHPRRAGRGRDDQHASRQSRGHDHRSP